MFSRYVGGYVEDSWIVHVTSWPHKSIYSRCSPETTERWSRNASPLVQGILGVNRKAAEVLQQAGMLKNILDILQISTVPNCSNHCVFLVISIALELDSGHVRAHGGASEQNATFVAWSTSGFGSFNCDPHKPVCFFNMMWKKRTEKANCAALTPHGWLPSDASCWSRG